MFIVTDTLWTCSVGFHWSFPVQNSSIPACSKVRQIADSIFQFVFQELQQVLPSLPDQHSNKEGNYYGRITQPVVNFLLAKLALNAEIYMYD